MARAAMLLSLEERLKALTCTPGWSPRSTLFTTKTQRPRRRASGAPLTRAAPSAPIIHQVEGEVQLGNRMRPIGRSGPDFIVPTPHQHCGGKVYDQFYDPDNPQFGRLDYKRWGDGFSVSLGRGRWLALFRPWIWVSPRPHPDGALLAYRVAPRMGGLLVWWFFGVMMIWSSAAADFDPLLSFLWVALIMAGVWGLLTWWAYRLANPETALALVKDACSSSSRPVRRRPV